MSKPKIRKSLNESKKCPAHRDKWTYKYVYTKNKCFEINLDTKEKVLVGKFNSKTGKWEEA